MPLASIIVPAFNVEATLAETLASLLGQSFDDFEVLVVDDGSSDSTLEVADQFSDDARLRVISQPNRGLAGARNSGIAAAQAEYIGFCDADDLWMTGKLAAHVEQLRDQPGTGISYSGSALINGNSALIGQTQRPRLAGVTCAHMFKRNPVGNGSAAVLRRKALRDIAWRPDHESERDWCFDETFRQSEDIECWLRLMLTTDWDARGVPGLLTRYRISSGGLSAATDRQLIAWERMVVKLQTLDPEFFRRHTPAARAYQLRYLSRRAVQDLDASGAWAFTRAWLASSLRPLVEEPLKSVVTLAATGTLAAFGAPPLRAARALLSQPKRKDQ